MPLSEADKPAIRALYRSISELPQPWRWFLEKRSSSALLTLCVYVPALSTVPLVAWLAAQVQLADARETIAEQAEMIVAQAKAQEEINAQARAFEHAFAVAALAERFAHNDVPLAASPPEPEPPPRRKPAQPR